MDCSLFETRTCHFSPCRTWRYRLDIIWNLLPPLMVIGLNPSTADEKVNDPTVRRCIRFAKDWGCGGLRMTNIFAFRSTDPAGMKAAVDPVGPENTPQYLAAIAKNSGIVLAAWGNHGAYLHQDKTISAAIPGLQCLGVTKTGQPKHPLYIKANTTPTHWQPT